MAVYKMRRWNDFRDGRPVCHVVWGLGTVSRAVRYIVEFDYVGGAGPDVINGWQGTANILYSALQGPDPQPGEYLQIASQPNRAGSQFQLAPGNRPDLGSDAIGALLSEWTLIDANGDRWEFDRGLFFNPSTEPPIVGFDPQLTGQDPFENRWTQEDTWVWTFTNEDDELSEAYFALKAWGRPAWFLGTDPEQPVPNCPP